MPDNDNVAGGGLSCGSPDSLLRPAASDSKRIQPDPMAIMALQRVAKGSKIHQANILIQKYKDFCFVGDENAAEDTKRQMYELAIKAASNEINTTTRDRRNFGEFGGSDGPDE